MLATAVIEKTEPVFQPVKKKKYTWDDLREMDIAEGDTNIYELLNGEIVKRASPNTPHQRTAVNLTLAFGNFIKRKKVGELLIAPYDVFLDEENAGIQPDLLFVSKERSFIIREGNGVVGAPDLIIEIMSRGSIDRDRIIKKDIFERFAVKEYWIVDPLNKSIEVYQMKNNRYQLYAFGEEKGFVKSAVLKGFKLALEKVFVPGDEA